MNTNRALSGARSGIELLFSQRWVLLCGVLLSGIILATLGDNRRELARLGAQRTLLKARVGALTASLAAANTEIVKLQNDSSRLEKDARERLLMGRPGEYLIPVREPQPVAALTLPAPAFAVDRRNP